VEAAKEWKSNIWPLIPFSLPHVLPPSLPPALPQALGFAGIDDSPEALRSHFLALVLILAASYIITYLGLTVRARYFIAI